MTSPRVHSFDVFDTSLVRSWARPADLFLAAGEDLRRRGLIPFSAEQWRTLRIEAERKARRRSRAEETTLEEIYRILSEKTGWTAEQGATAIRIETDCEADSLRPAAAVAERIRAARADGKRVVFLSDMYLPSETIRGFLAAAGLWRNGDGLYVSSERGVTKASGRLYQACLDGENIPPGDLFHLGDNEQTDFRVPQSLNIAAEHYSPASLNRFERRIADDVRLPALLRSRVAGAARQARLTIAGNNPQADTIRDVSASVAGPVLLGYVSWCLSEAGKRGLKRLYFVSRDGQVLLRIAERLRQAQGLALECRYLFGSRQAFHLPALEDFGERVFDWLLEDTSVLSVRSLFGRLGAKPEEFAEQLQAAGFPGGTWDANIPPKSRTRLRPVFENPKILLRFRSASAGARELLVGYLRQEGLLDGTPWGLVDMGWRGRLQNSLSRTLSAAGVYPDAGLTGFYFALFHPVAPFGRDRVSVFLEGPDGKAAAAVVRDHIPVLEVFTAADHGLTLGYRRGADGRVTPVLNEDQNEKALAWGLEIQQAAVVKFAEEWTRAAKREPGSASFWIAVARDLLGPFLLSPTAAEAAAYGEYLHSEDQADQVHHRLAPPIAARRFWSWCFFKGPLVSRVTWVEASVRRSLRGSGFFLALVRIKSAIRRLPGRGRAR